METDFQKASETDDLSQTIDYHAVTKQLKSLVLQKQWNLIEAMAGDFAKMILQDFKPESVQVEIRKFILSDTKWVAVKIVRP
jgi:dihydroneopterin aldolase